MSPSRESLEDVFYKIGLDAVDKMLSVDCSDAELFGGFMIVMGAIQTVAQERLEGRGVFQELLQGFGEEDQYE